MTPPRSDALVLFGATGDLADKKIFPALLEFSQPYLGLLRISCEGIDQVIAELSANKPRSG